MDLLKLNQQNLSALSDRLTCPEYDRANITEGIVHIGVGGFHRSHQAHFVNQFIGQEGASGWGICGVGLREWDRKIYECLSAQDGLYTLMVQSPDGSEKSEVIGSITDQLLAVDTPDAVIEKMASADIKIVSLTITEGGYNFHPSTGEFDFENVDIQHELANPTAPRTVFGYITQALRIRKESGIAPFSVLSCDNIQHNGDIAKKMVLAFAKKQDPELGAWIEKEVTFPNTMVDRITPVTSQESRDYIKETYQIEDSAPVVCEPFIQWIVEDKFCNGRPELEKVGVQFVEDVTVYEEMKIRLLNAGHTVIGIPGAVHGFETINECMENATVKAFLRQFLDQEATQILSPVEGIDIEDYKATVIERFANPNIKDSTARICSESSAKCPTFLIPTLRENLEKGGSIKFATFVLAAWCYYSDKGVDEKGNEINIIDQLKDTLQAAAQSTATDSTAFVKLDEVFADLASNERFVELYTSTVQEIYQEQDILKVMAGLL